MAGNQKRQHPKRSANRQQTGVKCLHQQLYGTGRRPSLTTCRPLPTLQVNAESVHEDPFLLREEETPAVDRSISPTHSSLIHAIHQRGRAGYKRGVSRLGHSNMTHREEHKKKTVLDSPPSWFDMKPQIAGTVNVREKIRKREEHSRKSETAPSCIKGFVPPAFTSRREEYPQIVIDDKPQHSLIRKTGEYLHRQCARGLSKSLFTQVAGSHNGSL